MVGKGKFSDTQGPEDLQNRTQPRQRPSLVIGGIAARPPLSHAGERLAEKGKGRLGAVQAVGPAAQCGRIGHTVRVFERRSRFFPGAALHKAPPHATDANPIVMFIMRLLATASVADDRITFTSRTSPQNNLGATHGPIRFQLVRRCGKWDKQNRTSLEFCPGLTCQDLSRKRSSFLLKQKSNWKRITLLACSFYGCDAFTGVIQNIDGR